MKVTDEMLMALADGELDSETARDIMRSVAADPALGRRIAEFRETRVLAKEAFANALEEAVPDRLVAAVARGGDRRRWAVRPLANKLWLPLGAAIAASAVGFAVGMMLTTGLRQNPSALPDARQIVRLLETAPSGEVLPWSGERVGEPEGIFEATASYPVADGVCRTFSLISAAPGQAGWRGVACHHGEAWNVEMIIAGPRTGEDVLFSTASDRGTQSIDSFLDSMGAGESLDATVEEKLRTHGWRTEQRASPN